MQQNDWTIIFYIDEKGHDPVREFLEGQRLDEFTKREGGERR